MLYGTRIKNQYIYRIMKLPNMIKKFFGVALILMSVVFAVRLILFLPILVSEFLQAIKENVGYYWGSFTFTLVLNIIMWVVTYFMFKLGRNFYNK